MIDFVNAKINIGLQIVSRRPDGYHNLQSVFYPVGKDSATPQNPSPFCDVLELSCNRSSNIRPRLHLSGRKVDCPLEKNLVYKAAMAYLDATGRDFPSLEVRLEKHLPDGAGMGGGSADAAFTLKLMAQLDAMLNEDNPDFLPLSNETLERLALQLGADCPYFLYNRPAFVSGIGEEIQPISLSLQGYRILIVKPKVSISTAEAFAGVTPRHPDFDLHDIASLPIEEWRKCVVNDFEASIFPRYPFMAQIKEQFYKEGALYASLTGSGSCIYGIFASNQISSRAQRNFDCNPTIEASYLLNL